MGSLKRTQPALRFGLDKVTPDEMDMVRQYIILNPSVTDTYFGTVSSATASAFVIGQNRADYPRNLLFVALGVAGGMGGTAVVNGKDQFGNTISETLSFGSAAGGGTVAGTKVFAEVTSGTFTPVGLGGTAVGTAKLGVAIGTSSTSPIFGLPDKIGGTSDIKAVTWIDADTAKQHGAASNADTTNHAVRIEVSGGVAAADSYVVRYRSTYNPEDQTVNTL
jgi:hypothetical protein